MSWSGFGNHARSHHGGMVLGGALVLALSVLQLALVLPSVPAGDTRTGWVLFSAGGMLLGLVFVGFGVHGLLRGWLRHPDVRALARYGPPGEVAAAIDAELALPEGVLAFAHDSWASGHTYLTPSWLVHVRGGQEGVTCLRLDSIVRAGRAPAGLLARVCPVNLRESVVFEDEHGVRITVADTEESLARLLAEVLARVPWALRRFGEDAGASTGDATEHIVPADRPDEQVRRGVGS